MTTFTKSDGLSRITIYRLVKFPSISLTTTFTSQSIARLPQNNSTKISHPDCLNASTTSLPILGGFLPIYGNNVLTFSKSSITRLCKITLLIAFNWLSVLNFGSFNSSTSPSSIQNVTFCLLNVLLLYEWSIFDRKIALDPRFLTWWFLEPSEYFFYVRYIKVDSGTIFERSRSIPAVWKRIWKLS